MVEKVIAYQKQRGGEGQHQQRSHAEGGKKDGETSQDAKEIDGKGGVDLVVVVGGDLAVGQMVGQGESRGPELGDDPEFQHRRLQDAGLRHGQRKHGHEGGGQVSQQLL